MIKAGLESLTSGGFAQGLVQGEQQAHWENGTFNSEIWQFLVFPGWEHLAPVEGAVQQEWKCGQSEGGGGSQLFRLACFDPHWGWCLMLPRNCGQCL